ncbi:hypothetical protein PHYSODRAFT_522500, partial [Phytophthora sojae]
NTAFYRRYFCNVGRGREKTCFTIWHNDWNNGNDIPRSLLRGHKLRDRPPAARPGKKRRRTSGAETGEGNAGSDDSVADTEVWASMVDPTTGWRSWKCRL